MSDRMYSDKMKPLDRGVIVEIVGGGGDPAYNGSTVVKAKNGSLFVLDGECGGEILKSIYIVAMCDCDVIDRREDTIPENEPPDE